MTFQGHYAYVILQRTAKSKLTGIMQNTHRKLLILFWFLSVTFSVINACSRSFRVRQKTKIYLVHMSNLCACKMTPWPSFGDTKPVWSSSFSTTAEFVLWWYKRHLKWLNTVKQFFSVTSVILTVYSVWIVMTIMTVLMYRNNRHSSECRRWYHHHRPHHRCRCTHANQVRNKHYKCQTQIYSLTDTILYTASIFIFIIIIISLFCLTNNTIRHNNTVLSFISSWVTDVSYMYIGLSHELSSNGLQ